MKTIELTDEEAEMLKNNCTANIKTANNILNSFVQHPKDVERASYYLRLSKSILEKL